jgi:hypothetical protein
VTTTTPAEEQALADLRQSLLGSRPRPLAPEEGEEAFKEHKNLASEILRAALLDKQDAETERAAWVRYIRNYFPVRRRTRRDAELLWKEWRCALIKKDAPRGDVTVSHGKQGSPIHWKRGTNGRLNINLEDMWRDFERSVDKFIAYLDGNDGRRAVVLGRLPGHLRSIEFFRAPASALAGATVYAVPVSAAQSVTASAPPPRSVNPQN